jgi:multidrug efflux pump subunit AcrB
MTSFSLKHPFVVIALSLLVAVIGLFSFKLIHTDLFPDTTPPQVAIITMQPGASAESINHKITQIIEKELSSISGLKKISSTSRDEVSSINAEFYYSKSIGEAVIDVQNAIGRIQADLPTDIKQPMIYRITNTTSPLMTIALFPKTKLKSLKEIRILAKNQISDALLNIEGVADIDIFGANKPEIQIRLDKNKLQAYKLTVNDVLLKLRQHNKDFPAGYVYTNSSEFIVSTYDEFKNLKEIENLPIFTKNGKVIFLRNLAKVELAEVEPHSIYHGNSKEAIAINVKRLKTADTVKTIQKVKEYIKTLVKQYPDIGFELTTDQSPIIDVNIQGMRSSLIQAIILTALVIFIFMADFRAAIIISASIPMAFMASLIILWMTPYTLNMVTLSGLIIAVGMVVDASIVVLENIFRHYRNMKNPDALEATKTATDEVKLSITAGMLTTVVVLLPVMFTGGYTQQVMRPLNLMICLTLVGSLIAALTIVPLLTAKLLSFKKKEKNALERLFSYSDNFIEFLSDLYTSILKFALKHRFPFIIASFGIFVLTMKIIPPLIGKEMMPAMDTGISMISFTTSSDMSLKNVEKIVNKIEKRIRENKEVLQISTVIGSEPGEISFGGGAKPGQNVEMNIRLKPRNERDISIWDINDKWRTEFELYPGIRDMMVTEYGATPMSTTKAPLDVIVSGPDIKILDKLADKVVKRLKLVKGVKDIRRSWYLDKTMFHIIPNNLLMAKYGITTQDIANETKFALKGGNAGTFELKDYLSIPITVKYGNYNISTPLKIQDITIQTKYGLQPINAFSKLEKEIKQPFITRENLQNTVDITAINKTFTIGQVAVKAKEALKDIKPPAGYKIEVAGTMAEMSAGNAKMVSALLIGLVLLYVLLLAMFKSFLHPITIMAAIPLAVAGAFWGLIIFDKPMCKPAMMGIIFLGGTIVNNSILLIDFIIQARNNGETRTDAIVNSVKLRIRPIMMTTVSTIIGLTPLIFEMAVGLERMSPLGIAAAFGLTTGTILTLVIIPVVYTIIDDISAFIKSKFIIDY